MKRLLTSLVFLLLLVAACGDDSTEVGTGSSDGGGPVVEDVDDDDDGEIVDDETSIPAEPDGGIGDGAAPLPENERVVTDDEPVDGKITTPFEVVINPQDEAELFVRFVGGDPNCTAAYVSVLTESPDLVEVELIMGITSDALAKSCLAGEFNLRVDVVLSESAAGKRITWARADSGSDAVQLTPDLTTDDFIGLTEGEASDLADENIMNWRVVRVDGEDFEVTADYSPSRLNFEIDNGKITGVTLG